MAENTKNRLTGMLLSKSRRARYIRTFVVLAACVAIAVAVALHQSGIAMTHEEQILTCPVSGVVAHTHNESCYDADGNLVCALPEIELHTHGDDCYTEVKELTCGLEESDEHKHTDACYTVTRKLTCGKEEVTEEHVHGPGCFTTVTVGEAETQSEGTKPQVVVTASMPAQKFEDKIMDDKGNEWVHVTVSAPEGAFPEGTTMRINPLDAESVRSKVEDAINKQKGPDSSTVAKQMKAVDIAFFDPEGNEIEPAAQVEVKITSNTVSEIKDPVLVHVDRDEAKDAQVVKQVNVVNQNEGEQATETNGAAEAKDTLKFNTNEFSPYVIVETETIAANVITANGETYAITVSYGLDAGIPEGAKLVATEVQKGAKDYDAYANETAQAVQTSVDDLAHLRMFDITIQDATGKELEPKATVDVKIQYVGEGIANDEELKVVHLADSGTQVIDPATEGKGNETDTLTFKADSFSIYSVVSYKVTGDLNGKQLAIVHVSTTALAGNSVENNTRYIGRAMQADVKEKKLVAANVVVEQHESGLNIVTSNKDGANNLASPDQVAVWTFEAVEGQTNKYYIKVGSRYLKVKKDREGNYNLELTDQNGTAFTVTEGKNNNAGMVSIKADNDHYLRSSVVKSDQHNGNAPRFEIGNNDADKIWLTLCEIEKIDPTKGDAYTGTKVSATELVDGESYLIYKNIYNPNTGSYEDYIIDGNGNPVRAYDKGDTLTLYSETAPVWMLKVCKNDDGTPNGYYIFKNEQTGKILHPLADGTLIKDYDQSTSEKVDGVALKGRENNEYTSTIEYWDDSAKAYYGYQIAGGSNGISLQSGTGANSMDFSFARRVTNSTDELHTVKTVDSAAQGITIHMFNYNDRSTIANVTGSDGYGVGVLPGQHVKAKLKDGYPEFTNNNTGKTLFDPNGAYHKGTGNNLFLESIYKSTGYYEYSSFNNFAHYNANNGTFTVYSEQGTPSPTSSNFYFKRGNFFPYNELNTSANAKRAQNLYNGDGKLLDYADPANDYAVSADDGTLYGLKGNTDFYFGMTMDFNFLMPKEGKIDGNPLIYEFNGDDDLWIYVDGVLVLDIGGVHDAWSGKVDFATGQITGGNGGAGKATTIKQCFKNANIFPDGTTWDDSKVDQYFKGDTFVEYGSHKFNMFYMEHGAGASNLETRFNLPVIEKGKVEVSKALDNTSQTQYANVSFAYQMFKKVDTHYEPVTSAVYKDKTGEDGKPLPVEFTDGVKFSDNSKVYDKVFYLKPGETAVFSDIVEDQEYYVQEIGVKSQYYDEIYINGVKIDGKDVQANGEGVYRSTDATPLNRARVDFVNHCDNRNSNELLITKRLEDGTPSVNDTFEFRVMLENASGELANYYQGTYYIRDDSGKYYRYENGSLVSNGQTPYPCTAGNYGTIASVPANYTVVIKDLVAGTDFYVDEIRTRREGETQDLLIGNSDWQLVNTEVKNTDGTAISPSEISNATIYNYVTGQNGTGSSLGKIEWNKDAQVVFTNKLSAANVDLKKVNDKNAPLAGATFELTRKNGDAWVKYKSDVKPDGQNATVTMDGLRRGFYKLEEKVAPEGYTILNNKFVYFEVYSDNGQMKVRLTDANGTPTGNSDIVTLQDANKIVVKNTPGAAMPQTGGTGTTVFYAAGGSLVGAGLIYWFSRKRFARHGA